jgi:hypothetical protein
MDEKLEQFVEQLKTAAGANLRAVVLYGSAVAGDFHTKHSNFNLLCILTRTDVASLEALYPAMEWWRNQEHAAPLVFTLEELRNSADVFAIELMDMKTHHRMLHGEDFFAGVDVPAAAHRLQVERELRTNWLRLRQAIVMMSGKERARIDLMLGSISSFATLFRHALTLFGEPPARDKRDAIARIASVCRSTPAGFEAILDLREGKKKENEVNAKRTLESYLELVDTVTNEVDRRLGPNAQ